jgi:branched-chain amino acid transport system substrate-binding protein
MRSRTLGRAGIAAVALLLLAVMTGFPRTAVGQTPRYIRLGAAISETGNLAAEGKLTVDGYNFAVDWINAHGGVKINGQAYALAPIQYYDDESSPAQSAALVDKLATQDHIMLILGPYSSDNTIAAAAVSSRDGAVLMADEGVAKQIWASGNKWVVGPNIFDYQYMNPVVDALLARKAGVRTAVVTYADDAFSTGVAKGAQSYLEEKGIKVLASFRYSAKTNDVSSMLAQMKPYNADILLSSGHVEDAILITRQLKQNSIYFKAMAFTVAPPTPEYVKALGRDAEQVIGPSPWIAQAEFPDPFWGSTQKFVAAFKAKDGYVPDYHVQQAATGVELFALAVAKAGTADPAKIAATFQNATYQTMAGTIHFGDDWHETNQSGDAIQIVNGVAVPIWPAKYVHNLVFPMAPWAQR